MKLKKFMSLAFTAMAFYHTPLFAQIHRDSSIEIKVTGIICGMDVPLIADRVKKEPGTRDCTAITKPGAMTKFRITYDPGQTTYKRIVEAVEDAPSCQDPKDKPYRVKRKQ